MNENTKRPDMTEIVDRLEKIEVILEKLLNRVNVNDRPIGTQPAPVRDRIPVGGPPRDAAGNVLNSKTV